MGYPSAGINSDFAATLHGTDQIVFCKGTRTGSRKAWMHHNEAEVNPWLPRLAPRLHWRIETDGWLLLGFEHAPGRHPDLSPGSADLDTVAAAVSVLSEELNPCPPVRVARLAEHWRQLLAWHRLAANPPDDLSPWIRSNLEHFVRWESRNLDLIDGDSLLHTDLHPLNILIGGQARVIDWAWARKGAAWVDAAFLVLRLIEAGHEPHQAERWAEQIPAWRDASDSAVTAFAVTVAGVWEHMRRTNPKPHSARLVEVAVAWAQHRLGDEMPTVA
ncbi:aminoglycoside phosphotransferase family protein [Goodfellowiella coeruleoviolacea]|uniref:aminoglycoside phosphotransferase family protein n=1 Tax=Goodfellowiella coeruleoviolacea TaxID=334858 RepID=UPI0020A2D131|nr:aminoglycoside phosphotransferase family protein [Goodfellowiella coeruleoviolacea]